MDALALQLGLVLSLLSSPVYSARESAPLDSCPPLVLQLLADHPDLEIRHRVASALERQRITRVRQLVDACPLVPWIDAIDADMPERWELIRWHLEACRAEFDDAYSNDWRRWREAMKLYLLSQDEMTVRRYLAISPWEYWNGNTWVRWNKETRQGEPMEAKRNAR